MAFEEVTIGGARLILGDCREVLPTLPKVDAVITDPPYGVGLTRKKNAYRGGANSRLGVSHQASVTYEDGEDETRALVIEATNLFLKICKRAAIFTGNRLLHDYPRPKSIGGVFVASGAGRDPWGFSCFNPIIYYGKCPYLATGKGSRPNSFRDEQPNLEKIDHPCPKPNSWMKWLVNRASLHSETVLDPFMGSGTTGVACMNLGRKFIGIEIERKYFDIACERIARAQAQGQLLPPDEPKPEQDALGW